MADELSLSEHLAQAKIESSAPTHPFLLGKAPTSFGAWNGSGSTVRNDGDLVVTLKEPVAVLDWRFPPVPLLSVRGFALDAAVHGPISKVELAAVGQTGPGGEEKVLYIVDQTPEAGKAEVHLRQEAGAIVADSLGGAITGLRIRLAGAPGSEFRLRGLAGLPRGVESVDLVEHLSSDVPSFEYRRAISAATPAGIDLEAALPSDASLMLDWGEAAPDDGPTTFDVEIRADGEREARRLSHATHAGRRFASADLSPFAGKSVRLSFSTGAERATPAAWLQPRILRRAASGSSRPNVLIYVVDTLRADRLGAYGSDRGASPNLDRLSRDGVVFERTYAPAPWTLPSVVSLFTAKSPVVHGFTTFAKLSASVAPADAPVLGRLHGQGYELAGFVANDLTRPVAGLFDEFFMANPQRRLTPETRWMKPGESSSALLDERVGQWLAQRKLEQPFFLYLQPVDPHAPRHPPVEWSRKFLPGVDSLDQADYFAKISLIASLRRCPAGEPSLPPCDVPFGAALRERLGDAIVEPTVATDRALYDASIAMNDAEFGRLLDLLDGHGLLQNTIVVFTSDHGEEFLEHGGYDHGQSVYDDLIRVPLVIWLPPGLRGNRSGRVASPVSLDALMPTIAELLSIDDPSLTSGGLEPPMRGAGDANGVSPVFGDKDSSDLPWLQRLNLTFGRRSAYVVDGPWKAILTDVEPGIELYDLAADPGERENLAEREAERARRLRERLAEYLRGGEGHGQAPTSSERLAPSVEEHLRSLGYVE